jgi:hypothetical protein
MVDPLKNVSSGYRVWQNLDAAGEVIPRQPPFFPKRNPSPLTNVLHTFPPYSFWILFD